MGQKVSLYFLIILDLSALKWVLRNRDNKAVGLEFVDEIITEVLVREHNAYVSLNGFKFIRGYEVYILNIYKPFAVL